MRSDPRRLAKDRIICSSPQGAFGARLCDKLEFRRSQSTSSVFAPAFAKRLARLAATVLFPSLGRAERIPMNFTVRVIAARSIDVLTERRLSVKRDSGSVTDHRIAPSDVWMHWE